MKIQEYTREACPICGHTTWCGRRDDGLILCKRPSTPPGVDASDVPAGANIDPNTIILKSKIKQAIRGWARSETELAMTYAEFLKSWEQLMSRSTDGGGK